MSCLHGVSERTPFLFLDKIKETFVNDLPTLGSMVYRNPVFHQVVFASIIGAIAARTTYLLQCTSRGVAIPPKARSTITSMFNKGLGLFAFGFFVWNIDNIYCRGLMDLKMFFGWPTAFFLEGELRKLFFDCVFKFWLQGIRGGTF